MKLDGVDVQMEEGNESEDGELVPGKYFVVEVLHILKPGLHHMELRYWPGITNQSREQRLQGWLGNTNDIYRCAHGAVEIYADHAAGGRLRAQRIDAEELLRQRKAAEELFREEGAP